MTRQRSGNTRAEKRDRAACRNLSSTLLFRLVVFCHSEPRCRAKGAMDTGHDMRIHFAALLTVLITAGCAVGTGAVVRAAGPNDLMKLRKGPGFNHDIIIGLPDGTRLTRQNCVTTVGNVWCRVTLTDKPSVAAPVCTAIPTCPDPNPAIPMSRAWAGMIMTALRPSDAGTSPFAPCSQIIWTMPARSRASHGRAPAAELPKRGRRFQSVLKGSKSRRHFVAGRRPDQSGRVIKARAMT